MLISQLQQFQSTWEHATSVCKKIVGKSCLKVHRCNNNCSEYTINSVWGGISSRENTVRSHAASQVPLVNALWTVSKAGNWSQGRNLWLHPSTSTICLLLTVISHSLIMIISKKLGFSALPSAAIRNNIWALVQRWGVLKPIQTGHYPFMDTHNCFINK